MTPWAKPRQSARKIIIRLLMLIASPLIVIGCPVQKVHRISGLVAPLITRLSAHTIAAVAVIGKGIRLH